MAIEFIARTRVLSAYRPQMMRPVNAASEPRRLKMESVCEGIVDKAWLPPALPKDHGSRSSGSSSEGCRGQTYRTSRDVRKRCHSRAARVRARNAPRQRTSWMPIGRPMYALR